MVGYAHLVILAVMVSSGRGQLSDIFFPHISQTVRSFSEAIVNQPVVKFASEVTGNVISSVVNGLTSIPLAAARSWTSTSEIPRLLNDKNILDSADAIAAEYTAGLSNNDARLDFQEMCSKYGYKTEKHQVTTEDGYTLSLFRIPRDGEVVFLMHGLLGSADDFIVAGPENGLAYLLADQGYDVWLGNARGNKHSRNHDKLKASDAAFWDFSWHEIGVYDLPSMIDHVLDETGRITLKYIGHSQGTTSFFVMASDKPDYNSKISLMVALSPVAYMSHVKSPIVRLLAPTNRLLHGIFKLVGVHEFLPDNRLLRALKQLMCGASPTAEILCGNILFLIAGFGYDQMNVTNLPVIYGHIPSGAATKQFIHYAQSFISGEFRHYDYGAEENLKKYGTDLPPDYKLSNVVAPVSLFYSESDWLSHPVDVDTLYNQLGHPIDIHKVPYHPFNHLDFLWAKDFKNLVYNRLRKLMRYF